MDELHPMARKLIRLGAEIKEITEEYGDQRACVGTYQRLAGELEAADHELYQLPESTVDEIKKQVEQELGWIMPAGSR